jgi:hypothetical protein
MLEILVTKSKSSERLLRKACGELAAEDTDFPEYPSPVTSFFHQKSCICHTDNDTRLCAHLPLSGMS